MAETIDRVIGIIKSYDERRGIVTIEAPYENFERMCRREYKNVEITMIDSRPLSSKQRRNCYAMIREISDWNGDTPEENKKFLKMDFWCGEMLETADKLFSLSNAPMSVVAAFQSWLARFIVRNDIPTKKPMLDYIDDVENFTFACLAAKKCVICGKRADIHHVDALGMGANRDTINHLGMKVLPLCREHHTEIHTVGKSAFMQKYHLGDGVELDKSIARVYGLNIDDDKKRRIKRKAV